MNEWLIGFRASDQSLQKVYGFSTYPSDTVQIITAEFALSDRWNEFDSVRAVWQNGGTKVVSVLDSEGRCVIPFEVLADKGTLEVNLVASSASGGVLTRRLTSYKKVAFNIPVKVNIDGNDPQSVTPSQFEQFVEIVKEDADKAEAGATDSEAWAIGERNGEEVGDTDPTYHNNSKYYSHRAEQQANTAGYMEVEIDANGHLMYYRTESVDADFYLDAVGHLILESVV